MEAKAETDDEFRSALEEAHSSYEDLRSDKLTRSDGPQPTGGVGGARVGVKCLHAHYAHQAATGSNPVGHLVAGWIEPLDCDEPCVVSGSINPKWVNKP